MTIQTEKNFSERILKYLREVGHDVKTFSGIGSAVTAIESDRGNITANSDYRREGGAAGF